MSEAIRQLEALDDPRRHGIGGNFPPPGFQIAPLDPKIKKEIDEQVAAADAWASNVKVIETEELASDCNEALNQLDARWKTLEDARNAEKKPYEEAVAKIRKKYGAEQERVHACRVVLRKLHLAWITLKQARDDAARRAEQEAAAEQRRVEAQLREQAEQGGGASALIAAEEAAARAREADERAAAIPLRAQTRGTLTGRPRSFTSFWTCRIVLDRQDEVYRHFRERAEVRELLQKLAERVVRAKDGPRPLNKATEGANPALPGVWIFQDRR